MVRDERESIRNELICNFKRMSTHPSLALITSSDAPTVCEDQYGKFRELIELVAAETLRGTSLILGDDGGDGIKNLKDSQKEPYMSLPSMKEIASFAAPDERNLFSAVMEGHSEGRNGNLKLIDDIYPSYSFPSGLSEMIYTTQLAAAERARDEIESKRHRRDKESAIIYSRLNDCWPSVSPSALDYRMQPKGLYYKSAVLFAPVSISAVKKGTRVEFYLSNERRTPFKGTLSYSVVDSSFKAAASGGIALSVEPFTSEVVYSCEIDTVLGGRENELCLVYDVSEGATISSKGTLLFTKPKRFNFKKPNISWHISGAGKDFSVAISSDCLSLGVEIGFSDIDATFEDNFFDITSSAPLKIGIHVPEGTSVETLRKQFTVKTINEIGKTF